MRGGLPDPRSRREFLCALLALPLAMPNAGEVLAQLVPLLAKPPMALASPPISDEFYIAGFQYHAGPSLVRRLRAGRRVELVAEPANPHDSLAVRVDYRGAKLGYIPRYRNRTVSERLRAGGPVAARIVDVRPDAQPWEAVRVEVRG